jgi:excisionase family DNA binding protein
MAMNENNERELVLLTTEEVAELLRVSKKTVYNWNYQGQGPPRYRPSGGRLLFDRTEVEAWLRSRGTSGQGGDKW